MKERNILYFSTTLLLTVLTLISFVVSFLPWAQAYGDKIIPKFYILLIPTIVLWFGWFLEDKGFLLSASAVLTILFFEQIYKSEILSKDVFITPQYAPIVKTVYVVTFAVLLAAIILSYFTAYILKKSESK